MLAVIAAIWLPSAVLAVERVVAVGLFNGKAVLQIDGKQRMMRKGEVSPEGVKLIDATPREALLEFNGQRVSLPLGVARSGSFSGPSTESVQIRKNNKGMFAVTGHINDQPVSFLVDTGATVMALNAAHAKQLGLPLQKSDKRGVVNTAGGQAPAYSVNLRKVSVGSITLHNVEAVVIEGNPLPSALLGMSFLRRVKMENQQDLMILSRNR
jgi:aspartyl protease family protein